jgi:hypothetical protein
MLDADLYTPETRVVPPRSAEIVVKGVRPAASRYAVVRSDFAAAAGPSVMCFAPELCTPGGKPVTAVPGESPMSPAMTEGPVLVIVLPAKTA